MFLRLADVDAGVRRALDVAVLDHDVGAEHGVDAVAAVGLLRPAGPLGADVAKDEPLGALALIASPLASSTARSERVTSSLLVIEQTLAAGARALVLEAQDRLVRSLAADVHLGDVERERGAEVEPALAQDDGRPGLALISAAWSFLGRVRAGLDPDAVHPWRRRSALSRLAATLAGPMARRRRVLATAEKRAILPPTKATNLEMERHDKPPGEAHDVARSRRKSPG